MQTPFADLEYDRKKKVTRRDRFLADIEAITPWSALVAELDSYYPKGGGRGRLPIGLERMLRMYIAQQCFGLSDEGIEDAIYDSQAIRRFVGIDLAREDAPDVTTLLKFRRLLEKHPLTQGFSEAINAHLAEQGLILREGAIVDATIVAAPPSTKNQERSRDPEMHQTRKDTQYFFGMKAHVGVDAGSGLMHSLVGTAANVADVTQALHLLHFEEREVFADAGYQGVERRSEHQGRSVWHIAMKHGKRKALREDDEGDQALEACERLKAKVRARVEHPFHVMKNLFGHRRTRYRGLYKNEAQLFTLFGLGNLVRARRALLSPGASSS